MPQSSKAASREQREAENYTIVNNGSNGSAAGLPRLDVIEQRLDSQEKCIGKLAIDILGYEPTDYSAELAEIRLEAVELKASVDAHSFSLGVHEADIAQLKLDVIEAMESGGSLKIELIEKGEVREIEGLVHEDFEKILRVIQRGHRPMLVGPAGSGKTHLASQLAEALDRPFSYTGAILQKYELLGFIDGNGEYVETSFYRAYTQGHLFLFDEIDASHPGALVAFNAALENGSCDFPSGMKKRHPNFVCIAAANTYGRGSREYVGRNPMDAATLERFVIMTLDYDESLERKLAHAHCESAGGTKELADNWVDKIQGYRAAAESLKIRHIISPRASMQGSIALAQGDKEADVQEWYLWKGLDSAAIRNIKKTYKEAQAESEGN